MLEIDNVLVQGIKENDVEYIALLIYPRLDRRFFGLL